MHISLENRVALITGASQGLGKAMAERFAASGADVVLLARRQHLLDELAEDLANAPAERSKAIRAMSAMWLPSSKLGHRFRLILAKSTFS